MAMKQKKTAFDVKLNQAIFLSGTMNAMNKARPVQRNQCDAIVENQKPK